MLNILTGMAYQVLVLLFGLVSRKFFLESLGIEVLGVHSFFSNMISWLSFVDLGIGNAVCYSLYAPLAKGDRQKVMSMVHYLGRLFKWILAVYLGIVAILLPCVAYSARSVLPMSTSAAIFFIWAISQLFNLYAYFRTIIVIADQKLYQLKIIACLCYILCAATQIWILLTLKNYVLFILTLAVFSALQAFLQITLANMEYPLDKKTRVRMPERSETRAIFQNTKALAFHGVSDYLFNATDNTIILNMLGAARAGIFSNYHMIFHSISSVLAQILTGSVSSVGNLLAIEGRNNACEAFIQISLISNMVYGVFAACAFGLADRFITVWLSRPLYLSTATVFILALNLMLIGLRTGAQIVRNGAVLYRPDRFIRLGFAVLNIVFSLLLATPLGIFGVSIATTVTYALEELLVLPGIIRKYLFQGFSKRYYWNMTLSFIAFLLSCLLCRWLNHWLWTGCGLIGFLGAGLACFMSCLLLTLIVHIFSGTFRTISSALLMKVFSNGGASK